ncbi:MAG: hypothetical protein IPJ46_01190 [Anaerolineales bacterium]|nr:hypothetical protein [Anaerolineales bacterium]
MPNRSGGDFLPHYHASAMDGFALRAISTNGAMPSTPISLFIGSEAQYVDTGDPLPEWANAVIPIENVESLDENGQITKDIRGPKTIRIRAAVAPWSHVRPLAEDIVATQLCSARGTLAASGGRGALAAPGYQTIRVARLPSCDPANWNGVGPDRIQTKIRRHPRIQLSRDRSADQEHGRRANTIPDHKR